MEANYFLAAKQLIKPNYLKDPVLFEEKRELNIFVSFKAEPTFWKIQYVFKESGSKMIFYLQNNSSICVCI